FRSSLFGALGGGFKEADAQRLDQEGNLDVFGRCRLHHHGGCQDSGRQCLFPDAHDFLPLSGCIPPPQASPVRSSLLSAAPVRATISFTSAASSIFAARSSMPSSVMTV